MGVPIAAGVPVTLSISGSDDPITEALTPLDSRLQQYINAQGLTVLQLSDGAGGFSIISTAITWTATLIVSSPNATDSDSLATSVSAAINNATGYAATSVSVTAIQSQATGNPGAAAPAANPFTALFNGITGLTQLAPVLIVGAILLVGFIVFDQRKTIGKAGAAALF